MIGSICKWIVQRAERHSVRHILKDITVPTAYVNSTIGSAHPSQRISEFKRQQALNFTIMPASGGFVVECASWCEKTDTRTANLHLITADEDLGQSMAKIITLEMLRK